MIFFLEFLLGVMLSAGGGWLLALSRHAQTCVGMVLSLLVCVCGWTLCGLAFAGLML